ncbi:hypothetical protein [Ectobacillus panaciterrae]|uniref:hypothetical protein n=1 Tax=Ectobacillus panaciterrae TaxID=363872 RepID=UPI0004035258|nr:hypothetical protein [Ectobacillus panaciterrae]
MINRKLIISLSLGGLILGGTFYIENHQIAFAKKNTNTVETKKENQQVVKSYSKEEIHYKILNSIDYFQTVKGAFEEYNGAISNIHSKVEYQVRVGNNPLAYSTIAMKDSNNVEQIHLFKDEILLTIYPERKEYGKSPVSVPKDSSEIDKSIEHRYAVGEKDVSNFLLRADYPPLGPAESSIFNQAELINYLYNYNLWNITNQDDLYLTRHVITIEGSLAGRVARITKGTTFKLWIDQETGVLLKKEIKNEKGDIVAYLKTKTFIVNKPIKDEEIKVGIPEDYKNGFEQNEQLIKRLEETKQK